MVEKPCFHSTTMVNGLPGLYSWPVSIPHQVTARHFGPSHSFSPLIIICRQDIIKIIVVMHVNVTMAINPALQCLRIAHDTPGVKVDSYHLALELGIALIVNLELGSSTAFIHVACFHQPSNHSLLIQCPSKVSHLMLMAQAEHVTKLMQSDVLTVAIMLSSKIQPNCCVTILVICYHSNVGLRTTSYPKSHVEKDKSIILLVCTLATIIWGPVMKCMVSQNIIIMVPPRP